ncbi:MAG: VOC family protein [Planctomycetes bacterium]|nr:VOC family protein [Planctomycetota bacterium]
MPGNVKAVPEGFTTITAQLTIENCQAAIDWYKNALGAEVIGDIARGPDGKIMHALLKVGTSRLMVNDPVMGNKGPKALGGSPASLWLYVNDCDASHKKAMAAGGARENMPPMDQFWGDRMSQITDPHGYIWSFATHKEDLTPQEIEKRGKEFFAKMGAGAPKK